MSDDRTSIVEQAIAWHLGQEGRDAAGWEAFVAWLEASPAHARAYDDVARLDALVGEARFPPALVAANDDAPVASRRWRWAAGAGVAAAALAVWLVPLGTSSPAERVFATRDGERRSVTLDDGTEVAMNGGTTLRIGAGGRTARLDAGEVMLHVVHDPRAPFTLTAGDQVIRDVGTAFNVTRSGDALTVAVSEGEVALQRSTGDLHLHRGDAVAVNLRTGATARRAVATDSVGGWQAGTLSFEGAPLADVAAALRRREGAQVALSGDLPHRPFTGIVRLTGAADRDIPHLADLIGATWRREGDRWVLAERSAAER